MGEDGEELEAGTVFCDVELEAKGRQGRLGMLLGVLLGYSS
jgi:hypothetical protein